MHPARSLMVFVPGVAVCALFAGLWLFTTFHTPRNSPNESALLPIDGDPDDLVEAIIRKQGGEQALQRLNTALVETCEYRGSGRFSERLTRTEVFALPNAWKIRLSVVGDGHGDGSPDEWGVVRGQRWAHRNDGSVVWLAGTEPAWLYCSFARYYMNPLAFRCPDLKKKVVGVKDIDGRRTSGIQLEFPLESLGIGANDGFKGPLVFEYFFDRESGRLLMSNVPDDYTTGRSVQTTYHEFRDADGIQIPWKMIHFFNGERGGQTHIVSASFPKALETGMIEPTPRPAGK